MNKKRHFLEAPEVKEYLVKGERFTKWSEVSEHFKKVCAAFESHFSNFNDSADAEFLFW